ncbi:type VI secretion system protein TssA [Rhizobium calliandrae]|uniref:Type VI secretion system protein TssA n=1 Tax=Rhizobium calliandrae TaxID=1312182 RepID=A0ABT7KJQ6_9HYPH|nr:type VI secretion system protein TssA [Rhizobium calliandrae]MDL2408869.1 type VI secretion system protein TssA [Rhizobium calliandrae]
MAAIDLDAVLTDPRASIGGLAIDGTPAGRDLRDEAEFDALDNEFRKMETGGPLAVDWKRYNSTTIDILKSRSKDIVLASRLIFGLQREESYKGLAVGVAILQGMVEAYWDGLFPPPDRERARAGALDWMAERLAPLVEATPPSGDAKLFALVAHDRLVMVDEFLSERMRKYPVAIGPLIRALRPHAREGRAELKAKAQAAQAEAAAQANPEPEEVTAASVAEVPQPVDPTPPPQPQPAASPSATIEIAEATVDMGAEKTLRALFAGAMRAASALRPSAPSDPRIYLATRFAAWGDILKAPPDKAGRTQLPPPQRPRLAELAVLKAEGNDQGLLLSAESVFASSPFCLDAQLLVANAMQALGNEYDAARVTVIGELYAFLKRIPELAQLSFSDGSPFADGQTLNWITSEVLADGSGQAAGSECGKAKAAAGELAQQGQVLAALKLLSDYSERCSGGRERFCAKLEIGEFCLRYELLQPLFALIPILERMAEDQALATWEPPLASALAALSWRGYSHHSAIHHMEEREIVLRKARIGATLSALDIVQAVRLTSPEIA